MIGPLVNHFPKEHRLLKRSDYDIVFSEGVRVHTDRFVFIFRRKIEDGSRLGLVVSKKVGNAVARNRVKRKLRETFRQVITSGDRFELVVIAKKSASNSDFSKFKEDLCYGIYKARKKLQLV